MKLNLKRELRNVDNESSLNNKCLDILFKLGQLKY